MEATASSLQARRNNFGVARLVLASLVIVSHAAELRDGNQSHELLVSLFHTISSGGLAVDGFFLLSGFLIVKSWDYDPRLGDFLRKRALRIYPGFVVASLLSVLVVGRHYAAFSIPFGTGLRHLAWTSATLAAPGYPVPMRFRHYGVVNGALWTIQWEALCYVLVAVMGLCGLSRLRWPWLLIALAGLAALGWGDRFGFGNVSEWARNAVRLVPVFATGACFYLWRDRIGYNLRGAALALPAFLGCLFVRGLDQPGIALFGGYLLFAFAFAKVPHIGHVGTRNDLSYGLYLYAWPVQQIVLTHAPEASVTALVLATLLPSLGLGWLSWRYVERPFLRLKPTARPTKPLATVAPVGRGLGVEDLVK